MTTKDDGSKRNPSAPNLKGSLSLDDGASIEASFLPSLVELTSLPESEQNLVLALVEVQALTRRFLLSLPDLKAQYHEMAADRGELEELEEVEEDKVETLPPRIGVYGGFSGVTSRLLYTHWDNRSLQTDQPLHASVRRRIKAAMLEMRLAKARLTRLMDGSEETASEDGWGDSKHIPYVRNCITKRLGQMELRFDEEAHLAKLGSRNEQSLPCSLDLASDYMLARYCQEVWVEGHRHEDTIQALRVALYNQDMNLGRFQEEVELLRAQLNKRKSEKHLSELFCEKSLASTRLMLLRAVLLGAQDINQVLEYVRKLYPSMDYLPDDVLGEDYSNSPRRGDFPPGSFRLWLRALDGCQNECDV